MLTALAGYLRRHHIALLALFVAIGGTSYAAVQVTGADIKDGTVTTADVKNKSLLAKDFKKGQLPKGARGPQGPAGPAGPAGLVTGYERTVVNIDFPASNSFSPEGEASLPPGRYVVTAVIRAENNNDTDYHARCYLGIVRGGEVVDTVGQETGALVTRRESANGNYYGQATLAFTGAIELTAGDEITPFCKRQLSETSATAFGRMILTAVPVTTIG